PPLICVRKEVKLLGTLINPRAHQRDLFCGQRFRRRPAAKAARATRATRSTRTAWATGRTAGRTAGRRIATAGTSRRTIARSARSAASTGAALGRHGQIVVDLRDCKHQRALFAAAGNDDLSVFTALEHRLEAVQAQVALRPSLAVATQA